MTGTGDVAVVVPTHNRRQLVLQTISSVRDQTRPPDRIIVVADGCEDGTVDALRALGGVQVIETPGLGAAAARNAGWQAGPAEFVAFVDDDCSAAPGWLEQLLAGFESDQVGLVQGRTVPAGPVGSFDRTIHVERETGLYESCNIAYRRRALEDVGGFRSGFGADLGRRGGDPAGGGGSGFGEDTDLAWRVRRAGWEARFRPAAEVRHAVFPAGPWEWLRESWRTGLFAYLVREVPELRDLMPGGRWMLRRQSLAAQLALAGLAGGLGAVATGRRPLSALLTLPYLAWLSRQTDRPGRAARLAARDLVVSAALVSGSVRHRSVLL